jgi:hypothetical protein
MTCACGCGAAPKAGNRYIHGHNAASIARPRLPERERAIAQARWQRDCRDRRRARGLCVHCGLVPVEKFAGCASCRRERAAAKVRRRAA